MALYPPEIQGTLPAFYETNGIVILTIPFSHNKAVQKYDGFYIKLKSIQSGRLIFEQKVEGQYQSPLKVDITDKIKQYQELHPNSFQPGSHYSIQIGYYSDEQRPEYYSTVGITKMTSKPMVYIMSSGVTGEELKKLKNNLPADKFFGVYNNEDSTEKVYQYKFELSTDDSLVESTDWQLNLEANYDNATQSHNEFVPMIDFENDRTYYIQYSYKTTNGLEGHTTKYKLLNTSMMESGLKAFLHASNNAEEGYVELTLHSAQTQSAQGCFKLERSSNGEWSVIHRFVFQGENPNDWSYKDFTVEQGVEYKYAIREYSVKTGIQSNRILLTETVNKEEIESSITADFDHMYLYDGQRQLKIKYNPKVSSFKNNILEQKQDTLGSKYAFFSRNGQTKYKEFPISGLISCIADDENLFYNIKSNKYDVRGLTTENSILVKCSSPDEFGEQIQYYDIMGNKLPQVSKRSFEENYNSYYYYKNLDLDGCAPAVCLLNDLYDINIQYLERKCKMIDHWFWDGEKQVNHPIETFIYNAVYPTEEEYNENPSKFWYSKKYITYKTQYNAFEANVESLKNERDFKLEVQEWLNNGQSKLFRSATEGNYVVRIMNVSLTPNDTLGRMLHTFNATAYEVAPNTMDSLLSNNLIDTEEPVLDKMRFVSIDVADHQWDNKENLVLSDIFHNIKYIECSNFYGGEIITINNQPIRIGGTGYYRFKGDVDSLSLNTKMIRSYGSIVLGYYSDQANFELDKYEKTITDFALSEQYFGENKDLLEKINKDTPGVKQYITKLLYGLFEKRYVVQQDNGDYYDPYTDTIIPKDEYNCLVNFHNEQYNVDLDKYEYIEIHDLDAKDFDSITIGTGVVCCLTYTYYRMEEVTNA